MSRLAAGGGDADADEQPRPRGRRTPRGSGRLWRDRARGPLLGSLRRDSARAAQAQRRPDPSRAVGQAGRRFRHPRMGAARAHLELDARAGVGDVGRVPAPGSSRADDVRPDDGRLLDLHRDAGHPPGHVRDVRRDRAKAVRGHSRGHHHADRGPRRDGRSAAAGDHAERRGCAVRRGRPRAHRAPAAARLPRRPRR